MAEAIDSPLEARNETAALTLPLLVTEKNRYAVGLLSFIFASAIYYLSNHFPLFEPRMLPMTGWDRMIPFIPQTVWIYVSEYSFFVIIYLLCKDRINRNRYVYAIIALQCVSVVIFLLWPTTYPRSLYPLPDNLGPWTNWVFSTLRNGDSPINCAPSLHVSSVLLCSFLFFNEQREKLWIFLTWATLISLSTLTTKQHYIVDVVSGLGMAVLFHWIFYRKIGFRELQAKR